MAKYRFFGLSGPRALRLEGIELIQALDEETVSMSDWQVGVDVGGTNTDLLFLDHDSGAFRVTKVPTTTADQSDAVMNGL